MNLTNEQKRWTVRLILWQLPIWPLIGANVSTFSEQWTNWNFLGLACQVVLFLFAYKWLNRHEDFVMRWFWDNKLRKLPDMQPRERRVFYIWASLFIGIVMLLLIERISN
jgi:hypothetical protein